jgi:Fe-S-cluster containining protein
MTYLKSMDPLTLDQWVQEEQVVVTAAIDCTDCGNCCRSLMISVLPEEATRLAQTMNLSEPDLRARYLETSETSDRAILNQIPCHFLEGNRCSIYADRFSDCRAFPHLDQPGFQRRLFSMHMYYGMCPMIYHVLEQLRRRWQEAIGSTTPHD